MANWSPDRQQAVQARCDRATRGPWVVAEHDNEPAPPAHEIVTDWTHAQLQAPVTVIGIGVGLGRVKHTIWADPYDLTFAAHARQDLPDALAEIARQQADLTRLAEVGKELREAAAKHLVQCPQAQEAALQALGLSSIDALSSRVVQRVAELPDRTSPDDWPEAMLVTSAELRAIVFDAIGSLLESKDAKEAK